MILDILFIWLICFLAAKFADAIGGKQKISIEEERRRRIDQLYGRW